MESGNQSSPNTQNSPTFEEEDYEKKSDFHEEDGNPENLHSHEEMLPIKNNNQKRTKESGSKNMTEDISDNNISLSGKIREILRGQSNSDAYSLKCLEHPKQDLLFFSINSNRPLCVECVREGRYKNHQITDFKHGSTHVRQSFEQLLTELDEKAGLYDTWNQHMEVMRAQYTELFDELRIKTGTIFENLQKIIEEKYEKMLKNIEMIEKESIENLETTFQSAVTYRKEIKGVKEIIKRTISCLDEAQLCQHYSKKIDVIRGLMGDEEFSNLNEINDILNSDLKNTLKLDKFEQDAEYLATQINEISGLEDISKGPSNYEGLGRGRESDNLEKRVKTIYAYPAHERSNPSESYRGHVKNLGSTFNRISPNPALISLENVIRTENSPDKLIRPLERSNRKSPHQRIAEAEAILDNVKLRDSNYSPTRRKGSKENLFSKKIQEESSKWRNNSSIRNRKSSLFLKSYIADVPFADSATRRDGFLTVKDTARRVSLREKLLKNQEPPILNIMTPSHRKNTATPSLLNKKGSFIDTEGLSIYEKYNVRRKQTYSNTINFQGLKEKLDQQKYTSFLK